MRLTARFFSIFYLTLLSGLALCLSSTASAQQVGDSVVTAALGVPADGESTSPLVYLTWWPTGAATWQAETHAIYSKSGEPDDPGSFTLTALVRPQIDALSVGQSILQGERLGDDGIDLSNNIDGLYDKILPVGSMGLNEKLAAIIEVAQFDAASAETLALLTRRHPSAALAAGVAFVDTISNGETRTYEIRKCPDGSNIAANCTVVAGRVVVRGGEVSRLPAPGRPVEVPFLNSEGEDDPRGNLNASLRWGITPELRERAFFQFGYNVYRVDAGFAESADLDTVTPDSDMFYELMETVPEAFTLINEHPILPDQEFSPLQAVDLNADPKSFFTIDDNGRYEEDGVPFEDGDRFYYLVAARDLLGRPGAISQGTPVTICFRMPPQAPMNVQVSNHYTYDTSSETQSQVFKLNWEPAQTRENGPEISEYWIYRWESVEQMHASQAFPHNQIDLAELTDGRIATVSAANTEYIDNVGVHPFLSYSQQGDLASSPAVSDSMANQTFWYSVRAVDASTCGGNISGNSGPAFGVLRDRVGPDAPSGSVDGTCIDLIVSPSESWIEAGKEEYDSGLIYLGLTVQRFDSRVAWAELYIGPLDDERTYLGRHYFAAGDQINLFQTLPKQFFAEQDLSVGTIFVRVGTDDDLQSQLAEAEFSANFTPENRTNDYIQSFEFLATVDEKADCNVHQPLASGSVATDAIVPVDVTMNLSPTSREWKLYRRVDDGPLTMIEQGIANYDVTPTVSTQDQDLPRNGGRVCYFLQVFDRQGNPSVVERIGCLLLQPRIVLPQPMISPVEPVGVTPETASARIRWFSSPHGVERFELAIRSANGTPDPEISSDLRLDLPSSSSPDLSIQSDGEQNYRHYITGRLGANFDAGPNYDVLWDENFESGTEYFIRARAIGVGGALGPWSHEVSMIWSSEVDFSQPFDPNDCVVPWPVRGTVEPDGSFSVTEPSEGYEVGLQAFINPQHTNGDIAYHGGAIRVGFVSLGTLDYGSYGDWNTIPKTYPQEGIFPLPRETPLKDGSDLTAAFYARINGEALPSFMVYRYQVPNATWETVSGDVYQVSPLIDQIAATPSTTQGQPVHAVFDPYVFLIAEPEVTNGYHLFIKDTQPVIQGASYRYLIVRFDDKGEIVQVIPLNTVTVN